MSVSTGSMRKRLILLLIPAVVVVWAVQGVLSYFDVLREAGELFDAQLAQSARLVLLRARHEIREAREEDEEPEFEFDEKHLGLKYEGMLHFQLRTLEGRILFRSEGTPSIPITTQTSGFADSEAGGESWRVYVLRDRKHGMEVQMAQHRADRERLARKIARNLLLPSLFALPVLAALLWFAVGRGLRPLRKLAEAIRSRAPQNLAPIEGLDRAPEEVRPIVSALNSLFARLDEAIQKERRFTADAAHELRTPLAALKAQAQVALGSQGEPERRRALDQTVTAVDRMTRLVEQLLTLARLDPHAALPEVERVDLAESAREVLRETAPEALSRKQEIEFEERDGRVEILANRAMLGVLIRNLVENAIRHSPEGGKVRVSAGKEGDRVFLEVQDTGQGIAPVERGRVFDRFYRVPGTQGGGSGLGLSIVQRIAELHSARIELSAGPDERGLIVKILFNSSILDINSVAQ